MEPQLYRDFARLEDSHWWFVGRRRILRDVLRRHLVGTSARILDVGCGTGGMLRMLREFGLAEGLDSSAEGLALCRERVGPDVELHQGELPDGIPAGRQYELVTAFDVLEHIPDVVGALSSVRSALSPGGTLVCTVPAYQFLWSEHDDANHHQRRYTKGLLFEHLAAAGFEPVYSSYYNAGLLAPIALVRLGQKLLRRSAASGQRSDFEEAPWLANQVLTAFFSAERFVVPRLPLPCGVSLLAVARAR
jgi:SAM-dependent methyltransferase